MITDTKNVWAEVLSSNQISRRWHDVNSNSAPLYSTKQTDGDQEWRRQVLQLLSDGHTYGGMEELSFEVADTRYSDFAFELQGDTFKWRWETFLLGPRLSAEVLSQHLIFPLITTVHLAFTSVDSVSKLSDSDLEKTVDKVGRTARRTLGTHTRNAVGRPRVSTTLRRMTALFNFDTSLPSIVSNAEKPKLDALSPPPELQLLPEPVLPRSMTPPHQVRGNSTDPGSKGQGSSPSVKPMLVDGDKELENQTRTGSQSQSQSLSQKRTQQPADDNSGTETETDDDMGLPSVPTHAPAVEPTSIKGKARASPRLSSPDVRPGRASPVPYEQKSSTTSGGGAKSHSSSTLSKIASSDSDIPPRPQKKVRPAPSSSSGEDSDAGPKRPAGKRGTRQPIQRGRRF